MVAVTTHKRSGPTLNWEDRKKLCEAWQKTNLSRSAFMRQHDLPKTFHNWCNKLLPKTRPTKPVNTKLAALPNDQWLQIMPGDMLRPVQHQSQQNQREPIEFNVICNDLKLGFSMPMYQIVGLIKELGNAATIIR